MDSDPAHRGHVVQTHSRAGGFTLIELLLTISIIVVLLSLLAPGLSATLASARSFRCQAVLRNVAFDFSIFADDSLAPDRGNDAQRYGPSSFRLATFVDAQLGLNEFWRWGEAEEITLPTEDRTTPLRCAEVGGPLRLRAGASCEDHAQSIGPSENISYSFNLRLAMREVRVGATSMLRGPVLLGRDVLRAGSTPLVWDADGRTAQERQLNPLFSAPPAGSTGILGQGNHWFPAARHRGAVNVAFIDGHVASTQRPLDERWDWNPGLTP